MNKRHMYSFELAEIENMTPCRVIYFKKPGANCYAANHAHNGIEINYIVSGRLDVECANKKITLRENDYAVINGHDTHSSICPDENIYVAYLVLIFSEKYTRAYFADYDSFDFDVNRAPEAREEIRACLAKIVEIIEAQRDFLDLSITVLTARILELLFLNCKAPRDKAAVHKPSVNSAAVNAEKYINNHFREKVSLSDVARHVGLSPQYFSRYFKRNNGQTFHGYLNHVRLRHTLMAIQTGDVSATQAALDNGFPDMKAFIAVFKKYFGCTLREYKKQNGIVPSIPYRHQPIYDHYAVE